ncbi:hypothetical protein P378_06590 [Desulforamulus profundi]|uniref:Uncharacterized protein n=1 Tax=Desulforamulus profundi TaxID=1383067 RepID=A0A2C6MGX0_9FIRM|nr:hypothetical protein P378_06590 [Desulforamulus profundi]
MVDLMSALKASIDLVKQDRGDKKKKEAGTRKGTRGRKATAS